MKPRVVPVVLVSGAVAAAAAAHTLGVYLPTYNTPHTPIAGVPHAAVDAGAPRPAAVRRLAFVVMDGLSYDLARELDELAPLRSAGALRLLSCPFPTYTSPALVSFVTGLDPLDHGIRLNGDLTGAFGLDTVTAAAHDAGVPVRLRSREWKPFEELMYPARDPGAPAPRKPPPGVELTSGRVHFLWTMWARAAGLAPLPAAAAGAPAREIELVYLGEVDEAGHRFGAASPKYLSAARHAGALVTRYAATLDLAEDAIVVVSDHGHRADGGHGGVEPEVQRAFFLAAGRGVRRGVELGARPTRDVAPTLSLLAGLRAPTSSLGRPMLDALDLGDAERAAALAAPFAQAARFACRVRPAPPCAGVDALVERLARADPAAVPLAEALLDGHAAERAAGDDARLAARRRLRFGLAVAALVAAAAALFRWRRAAFTAAARLLPLALLPAAIYALTLAYLGYRPSLSAMKGENYNRDTFLAATTAAVASLVVAIFARPPPAAPWAVLAGVAVPFALLAAWAGADPAALSPPVAAALLFEIAPLVLGAASLAAAMRLAERLGRGPR